MVAERARLAGWADHGIYLERLYDGGMERIYATANPSDYDAVKAGGGPARYYVLRTGMVIPPRETTTARSTTTARLPSRPQTYSRQQALETPRLDVSTTPRADIRLLPGAVATVFDELRSRLPFLEDGYEAGGWLFGRVRWNGRGFGNVATVDVEVATGLGDDGESRRRSVTIGGARRELERERIRNSGMRLVGTWHTHERPDEATPSRTDLQGALRLMDRERADFDLSLIVTPTERPGSALRSFLRPEWHAWVTHRAIGGEAVTVPGRFVEIAGKAR